MAKFKGTGRLNIGGTDVEFPVEGELEESNGGGGNGGGGNGGGGNGGGGNGGGGNGDPYPQPKRVVHVNQSNIGPLLRAAQNDPGTHIILDPGDYDFHNLHFGGRFHGTAEDPIVIKAAIPASESPSVRPTVRFAPTNWSVGQHGAIFLVRGQHVVLDGIGFEGGGGRHLNVASSDNAGVAEDVRVMHCRFERSLRHSAVVQGNRILFHKCYWKNNFVLNLDGTMGSWPYCAGSWFYEKLGGRHFSMDVMFTRCEVVSNYGRGIAINYSRGGDVLDCRVADNRFANIYFNNTDNIVCSGNRLIAVSPILTRLGNPPRGIEMSNEIFGDYPINNSGNGPAIITDNLIDGGNGLNGIRLGVSWNAHQGRELSNRYWGVNVLGNQISNCSEHLIRFDRVPTGSAHSNVIDRPIDGRDVYIGDPEVWQVRT